MKKRPEDGKDILLLFLYVAGATGEPREPIRGRTRLMKIMFIFREEIWRPFHFDRDIQEVALPQFFPWRFGPFSKDVFDDVEFFQRIGFVSVAAGEAGDATLEEADESAYWNRMIGLDDDFDATEYVEEVYTLTERGTDFIESEGLYEGLSSNQKEILREYKTRFNQAPLYAILQYVYGKYPQMTSRSEIRDQMKY
jgi:uncharacterized protein YwgA